MSRKDNVVQEAHRCFISIVLVLLERAFKLSTRFWNIVALGGKEGGGVGAIEATPFKCFV